MPFDLERFGIPLVTHSPRHADVLLVTGPVTVNMREALERVPPPGAEMGGRGGRLRSGTAGCSPTATPASAGLTEVIPVVHTFPGYPPNPMQLLEACWRCCKWSTIVVLPPATIDFRHPATDTVCRTATFQGFHGVPKVGSGRSRLKSSEFYLENERAIIEEPKSGGERP